MLYSILQKIVVPDQLKKVTEIHKFDLKSFLMPNDCVNFGYEFNKIIGKIDKETVAYVKDKCREFNISLAIELQMRIPENTNLLEKLSIFSQENVSRQIKPDISQMLDKFEFLCEDVDETAKEWDLLHRVEISPQEEMIDFWFEVYRIKNATGERKFKNICKFVFALLSLPISNACVERVFSIVNIVKDKLRNQLSVPMVQAILHVRCTSQIKSSLEFKPSKAMLKRFNSKDIYKKIAKRYIGVLEIFS